MDNEKNRIRGIWSFVAALLAGVASGVFLAIAESRKESYKYIFDSDYQDIVKFLQIIGCICLFFCVVELIQGIVLMSVKGPDNSNLIPCPDCHQMVSKSAVQCPHCGRALTPVLHQNLSQTKDSMKIEQQSVKVVNIDPMTVEWCGKPTIVFQTKDGESVSYLQTDAYTFALGDQGVLATRGDEIVAFVKQ